ncbi:hypothetical protein [Microbacterium sp. No. 7]|uniref:hypothetical protein n=1 Tax=Microbacterium sp. No. 7 TaxID=1714373 RepID=UPI0006CF523C|nr:hypothetical protein [Microbacterium sp. No. 7]
MSMPLRVAREPLRPTVERPLRLLERAAAARRPRIVYGIVAVAGVAAIAATQMGISILTTQGSYTIAELTRQQSELSWQTQMLQEQVSGLSSPQYLAASAAGMGMVVGDAPTYLRLSDAAVTGPAAPAAATSSINALSGATIPNALLAATSVGATSAGTVAAGDVVAPAAAGHPFAIDLSAVIDRATAPPAAHTAPPASADPATPDAQTGGATPLTIDAVVIEGGIPSTPTASEGLPTPDTH